LKNGFLGSINRDQIAVGGGLVIIVIIAWAYMLHVAARMDDAMPMAMQHVMSWNWIDWWSMLSMWSVMMVAMMVPSATPTILIYSKVNSSRKEKSLPYVPTSIFLSGYIVSWIAFSVMATIANWAIHTQGLLTGMMGASTSSILGGCLLVAAGIFQWTPWKYACLSHCRTPMGFIMTEWREGLFGAIRMGLKHGAYCVGCCWLLMSLLFVLGIMNLIWVGVLAAFVLVEKLSPKGIWISRVSGLGFFAWGSLIVLQPYL